MVPALLIRNAALLDGSTADVRIARGKVLALGTLGPEPGECVVDAVGGLLIPGLHDHHIHLAATASARASLPCGPPEVESAEALRHALGAALACSKDGWLRGVGYHESVAGMLDRAWLDRVAPDRPVRIQHRSGRMWFLNGKAVEQLLASGLPPPPGLDSATGRLFDEDAWLRQALAGRLPDLGALGTDFARLGVTGVTDMNPANATAERDWLVREALPQRIILAGTPALAGLDWDNRLQLGPVKVHLHEAHLIEHDAFIALIRAAHEQGRGVAVHCVTEVELVYALSALRTAGAQPNDRIEHASVAPDTLVRDIAELGIAVVTQPLFVFARGDGYRRDIPEAEWPHLYRLRAFVNAGVPLAGSSDAPYVETDPWAGMAAAVARRTREGAVLGATEALTPEQALALYLADPLDLRRTRNVAPGERADLCLLDRPWAAVCGRLRDQDVRLTIIAGQVVYDREAV